MARRIIVLVVCITSIVAFTYSAPAPKKKLPKPFTSKDFVGEWELYWGVGKGMCQLANDGNYYEQWYGGEWFGTWTYNQKQNKLSVSEMQRNPNGTLDTPLEWTATLKPRTKEGTLQNGGYFKLAVVKKDKPDF